MKDIKDLTCIVIDHGIFLPIARRLARECKKVFYWSSDYKAFPTVRDSIGDGFPDIERVDSVWSAKDECDLFVFPDIGFSDIQIELLNQGKIVWGARYGDSIETSRGKFLSALQDTSLPLPKYQKVIGMELLREYLRDREDQWIKISKFRGDWETLHWLDWRQSESELDARSVKLGPWKEVVPFYVFENIETDNEDGVDSWCIDGQFPSLVIHGMEAKDKAYLGTFQKYSDLPEEMRRVNDEFGPILGRYGYRSFFSTEVRITKDGQSHFIDPTCRAGSPPSQVMTEMIGNYAEIIWQGAQGQIVGPVPKYQFGVQAIVSVGGGRQNWRAVEIPTELDQWFKAGFCSMIDGRYCFPPDPDEQGGNIGWLVGIGNTAQEAIEHLKKNCDLLPMGTHCEFHSIADLLREVNEAEENGMEFSHQEIPKPEIVFEDKS